MKRVIYDFDDAIWLTDKKEESAITSLLRWRRKVKSICSFSYKVSCGNNYLQRYAAQYTRRSIVNPTTIDTQHLHNPALYNITKDKARITIGWTGSHSTLKYLYLLQNVLAQLQQKYNNVDLLVIADQKPNLSVPRLLYKPWSKDTEVTDLLLSDIGIMPLPDDEWSKGKCGFKALQYMALEIPAVASPVGVNNTIIQHGVNGFLCRTETEWMAVLEELIQDEALRNKTGTHGRKTVVDHYSVTSNARNFLSLFE